MSLAFARPEPAIQLPPPGSLDVRQSAYLAGVSPGLPGSSRAGIDGLLRLQRSVGNAAVVRLLDSTRHRPDVQRCDPTTCGSSDQDKEAEIVQRAESGLDLGQPFGGQGPGTVLRRGSSGPEVRALQHRLNEAGEGPAIEPDGIFGPLTEEAVVAIQSAQGLVPDGIVGPVTFAALDQVAPVDDLGAPGAGETAAFSSAGTSTPTGVGEGPVSPPGVFAPPGGGIGCAYEPGERKKSKESGGRFDLPAAIGPTVEAVALVWDFEPGRTATRSNHRTLVAQLVRDFKLDSEAPLARVSLLEGHTDCVDSEAKNSGIRVGRASEAFGLFVESGALSQNIDVVRPATEGGTPGDDSTVEGRARNRSVVIRIADVLTPPEDKPEEPGEDPRTRPCDAMSDSTCSWRLKDLTSVMVVGGEGAVGMNFLVKNRDSNCIYPASFQGIAGGLAIGAEIAVSPDNEEFTTFNCFPPKGLEGTAFVDLFGFGPVSVATIDLAPDTDPGEIDIGGFDIGKSLKGGFFLAEGTFSVANKGFRLTSGDPTVPGGGEGGAPQGKEPGQQGKELGELFESVP